MANVTDHASLGFILRPTNSFQAGWYNDQICGFERSFWDVAQGKDVRGRTPRRDQKVALVILFSRNKLKPR